MIKELIYKWFNLEPLPCQTCEVLKEQLQLSQIQNRALLEKLTKEDTKVEFKSEPIPPASMPNTIPWRVKRQLLEAEDRRAAAVKAEAVKTLQKPVDELEKELGISNASHST